MKKLAVITASLATAFTIFGTGFISQTQADAKTTVASNSPSLSINKIYSNSTTITGKATKGVRIIVRTPKKQTIATATASKTTGAYTLKLPAKQAAGSKLYVYARNSATGHYFYRIMTVQSGSATTTAKTSSSSKTATSTTSKANAKRYNIDTPTGSWKTNSYKGWSMKYVFSQKTGLNEYVYYGSKVAHPLRNASYSVSTKGPNFWQINVRAKGGAKSTFYMRFTASNKFIIVNSKNQAIKASVGKAPAANYTFNLQ